MELNHSNDGDFRSVIDDLTVQNKKLKRKLRTYEQVYYPHLRKEKLFEVKIHGLPGYRKRELEEILRSFASSVETEACEKPASDPSRTRIPGPTVKLRKLSSQTTSYSKTIDYSKELADSAYASMSGKTRHSLPTKNDRARTNNLRRASEANQQNIRSYLHEIPQTRTAKHSSGMSERSKMKLVVKRLEQLFTGKGAASHHSGHPLQQQQVLQSAAKEQKHEVGAHGPYIIGEGMREARILRGDTELQVDSWSEANMSVQQSRQGNDGEVSESRTSQRSRNGSPEQRPTRPHDLDLNRVQVPSENINYIHHLGIVSSSETDAKDGWVYLNLLTSMAQLHTLNVTPEFIRQAVATMSAKFELSEDGSRVRWQGEADETKLSSDNDDSDDVARWEVLVYNSHSINNTAPVEISQTKREIDGSQRPDHELLAPQPSTSMIQGSKRIPVALSPSNDQGSNFQYKPLFFHDAPSEQDDSSNCATSSAASSVLSENATSSNSRSHGVHESEAKLRRQNRGNGPIIFYNKARFCTDLSGDPTGSCIDEVTHSRYCQVPLGISQAARNECPERYQAEDEASLSRRTSPLCAATEEDSISSIRSALDLEDLRSSISDCISPQNTPSLMEASGLGGIQPEDNFVVKVRVEHGREKKRQSSREMSPFTTPLDRQHRRRVNNAPQKLFNVFRDSKHIPRSQPAPAPVNAEVISSVTCNLSPSKLPPPSYVCLPFSSSGSDSDGDDSSQLIHDNQCVPIRTQNIIREFVPTRPVDFFIGSSSGESKGSSCASTVSDSDDDSSIDLLAHARVLDPDSVAAREREFDSTTGPQLGEVPTGSSAATAGGGSGHNSRSPGDMNDADIVGAA